MSIESISHRCGFEVVGRVQLESYKLFDQDAKTFKVHGLTFEHVEHPHVLFMSTPTNADYSMIIRLQMENIDNDLPNSEDGDLIVVVVSHSSFNGMREESQRELIHAPGTERAVFNAIRDLLPTFHKLVRHR